jgi:replicative DNA helicase
MNDESRLPPQNLDAERGTLGSVLLDGSVLPEVEAILQVEDFYRDKHRELYQAIREVVEDGQPVDVLTVADHLGRQRLKALGGDEFLAELVNAVPHSASAAHYASIVRQKAVIRSLLEVATEILHDGYSDKLTADEMLEKAESRLLALGTRPGSREAAAIGYHADAAMARIRRRHDHGEYAGVETGFVEFDQMTDGLANGALVILAARPSIGKTAMGLQVAESAALGLGAAVLFVSLEMSGVELAERLLVSRSRVDGHKVRTGQALSPLHVAQLEQAHADLRQKARLWVDDTPSQTVSQIAASARRLRAKQTVGLVVVDYIQLIEGGQGRDSRQEQIAKISRRLKILAKELDCPVLALSQLNRKAEDREDHRPRMGDLRESGAIEQDADMVLLLHRPEYYDANDSPGVAELHIAKNRNGGVGTVKLTFVRHLARFENLRVDPPLMMQEEFPAY